MCSEKGKDFIGRMPNRKGFHYSTLFTQQVRPYITKFKNYQFFRAGHTYFGKKTREKFFGYDLNAYVYVDKENAANYNKEYHIRHPELIQKMDESQLSWIAYRGGYFVLLSNLDATPSEILDRYFSRTEIEYIFKTSKEYLNLLPLRKWHFTTVMGKILLDIICTDIILDIRDVIKFHNMSVSDLMATLRSLMSFQKNDEIIIDVPNKQTKICYEFLEKKSVPAILNIPEFRRDLDIRV